MHNLKSDISEFSFGNSSVYILVKKFYSLKIVVVHKLPNFDASVFDDFFSYNISRTNATSRGGYSFP